MRGKRCHALAHQSALAVNLLRTAVLADVIGVVDVDGTDKLLASLGAIGRLDSEINVDLAVLGRTVCLPGVDHDVTGLGGLHEPCADRVVLSGGKPGAIGLDLNGSTALGLDSVASIVLVGEGDVIQGTFGVVRVDGGFNDV